MWDEAKNPGSRRRTNSLIRSHAMKGNKTEGKTLKGESLNNFKARVPNPKEISSRGGLLLKRANPRGMLVGNPRKRVSIAMKWNITPKIAPNPNYGMGALR
jgi:hypothetical protein